MAVKQYSKKMGLELGLILFLSWLLLLLWVMSQWVFYGYTLTHKKLNLLIDTQKKALESVYQDSLLEVLPLEIKANSAFNLPYLKTLLLNDFAKDLLKKAKEFYQLMSLSSRFWLIKFSIFIASIPLFALSLIVGLIDGLNQRAIRKACLGRESSYVFHRLNHYLKKLLALLIMLWLSLPMSLVPAYVFFPISLMLTLMVAMTASRFKKYL